MPDWNTRLAVSFVQNNQSHLISPIDSFTPTFAMTAEALHSVEATHIGVIYNPDQMTFSMTVKAIGNVAGQLTALAMSKTAFDIVLQEGEGDDWAFKTIVMSNCIITSASPTAATTTGAPSATFSGFSLGANADPKVGSKVTVP